MAAELGFEPRMNESESLVLPLHHSALFFGRSLNRRMILYSKLVKKSTPALPILFKVYMFRIFMRHVNFRADFFD